MSGPIRFLSIAAPLLCTSVLLHPLHAAAFHQARGGGPSGNGPLLSWKTLPVSYSLQARCALGDEPNALNSAALAAGEDESTFNQLCHAAVQRAFGAWQAPSCTDLRFYQLPDTPTKEVGYDPASGAVNLNTVQFMTQTCDQVVNPGDACWQDGTCDGKYACFGQGNALVALTRNFYNSSTGELVDSDIEVNAGSYQFSAEAGDPLPGTLDIQNTVTHEAGHFIGLAHSCEPGQPCTSDLTDTAMYWQEGSPGETTKRTLKQDDIDGLCSIYPVGGTPDGGCSTGGGANGSGLLAPLLFTLLALVHRPGRPLPGARRRTYAGAEGKVALR
jgi:hypothetical protein